MVSDALLGPFALLVAALVTVGVLWRDHKAHDDRDRADAASDLEFREQLRLEGLGREERLRATIEALTTTLRDTNAVMARAIGHLDRSRTEGRREHPGGG